MRIAFDPDFDQGSWPGPLRGRPASAGEDWVGPSRFVQILETALGLGGPGLTLSERAARLVPAVGATTGFWSESAAVDPFATARRLLQWRDTLMMCGWRGGGKEPRVGALAALIAACPPALPDRLQAIHEALARRSADIESVELFAPRVDLEPLWQRTLELLEQRRTRIVETALAPSAAQPGTDLAGARTHQFTPGGDGSLRLLQPAGPLAAAEEVAAWLASIAGPGGSARLKPCPADAGGVPDVLVIGSDTALDAALHRYGLPTSGAPNEASDAVPFQILPLVLDLAWRPQDPQRAYELLSLRSGPVPGEVAWRLRDALGTWPAVDSDAWREALSDGLAAIEVEERRTRAKRRLEVIWDASVSRTGKYPVAEIVRRIAMLQPWLVGRANVAEADASTWRAAAAQCDSLLDLAQHSGLTDLTAPQLRHLVIEAKQAAGNQSRFPAESGLRHVGSPGGVAGPAQFIVWWRFDAAAVPRIFRLPLTRAERDDLQSLGVALPDPGRIAAAQARRWRRPLDQASNTLLLVCPEKDTEGEEVHPHPFWDELVSRIQPKDARRVGERKLRCTSFAGVVPQSRRPLLAVPSPRRDWSVLAGTIQRRTTESPSSVQTLLECPFQWVLQYAGGLYAPDSAQVDDGTGPRVLGELLHAIMNRLFAGPHRDPDDAAHEAGVIFDAQGPRLVAALFLPGADAQRQRVRRAAMDTAATLYGLMATCRLRVVASEQERRGEAFGTKFGGRVDLVLGDPPHILDLKWSGAGRKREALKQGAAVQLAAYSFLQRDTHGTFPPVGYFVMDAQRLLTTEPDAFPGAEPVDGPSPEETWQLVETTHEAAWRNVEDGRIIAPGAVSKQEEKPPKKPCVQDGMLIIPGECRWCDYTTLCGLAFAEEA